MVCLQVIRNHERTIQVLQQQLEDQRKSSDNTRRRRVPGSEAWAKVASEELSGKAQTGQTSSCAVMSSTVKQQQEHKEQHHHGHVRLGSYCKGMTDEKKEVKRRNQASSSTPNSLFPWPKPKFRTQTTTVEQYQLHERALIEASTHRSASELVHSSESAEGRANCQPATRPPPLGPRRGVRGEGGARNRNVNDISNGGRRRYPLPLV